MTAHARTIGPRELAAEAVAPHGASCTRITALPVSDANGRPPWSGALNVHDLLRAGVV